MGCGRYRESVRVRVSYDGDAGKGASRGSETGGWMEAMRVVGDRWWVLVVEIHSNVKGE
jgi:hypothetical protein